MQQRFMFNTNFFIRIKFIRILKLRISEMYETFLNNPSRAHVIRVDEI